MWRSGRLPHVLPNLLLLPSILGKIVCKGFENGGATGFSQEEADFEGGFSVELRENHMKLLIATHNQGKVRELGEILADSGIECVRLDDVGITDDVEETGATFTENAILKAVAYAAATQLLTLADDSGLEVDALNGGPGIYTKRYGEGGPFLYSRLLQEITTVPDDQRSARFRCVVALADKDGLIGTAQGTCEGMITDEPKGSGGFGYDPVFFLAEHNQTMAELSSEEKHKISHRGRAIAAILPLIHQIATSS